MPSAENLLTWAAPKHGTKGRLSIEAGPTLGSLFLMPRLKQFEQRWPDISLSLVPQANEGGAAGDLQLLLSPTRPKDRMVHLAARIQLFPVCSPSLIGSQPCNVIEDLQRFTLLHCDHGEEWRKWLHAAKAGALDRYKNFKLPNAALAMQAALQGQGMALASHITALHLLNAGKLVVPFRESVFSPHRMYITSGRVLPAKAPPHAFLAWAAEQLREGWKYPAFDPCR